MSTLTASHGLTLSEKGLKLIKAYEGFRPVDRSLINGQRVVGYGHRLYDERPMRVSKDEAEKLLKSDLEAFEDMVNENTHAPLTQGQFDALVSLAYNIGPQAFLESDTLRALNNGRPLDAANGFDIWRKSVIDGKTYVVDALMRRRTAEKALFLKTSSVPQPASGADLPPVRDEAVAILSTEDALPVFTDSETNGLVDNIPLDSHSSDIKPQNYGRRRGDGPVGDLVLSEVVEYVDKLEQEDEFLEERTPLETLINEDSESESNKGDIQTSFETTLDLTEEDRLPSSIIADAAADISERLDALIESAEIEGDEILEEWPDTLLSVPEPPQSNLVSFPDPRLVRPNFEETQVTNYDVDKEDGSYSDTSTLLAESDVDIFIDNLVEDDATRASMQEQSEEKTSSVYEDSIGYENSMLPYENSASRYVNYEAPNPVVETEVRSGYWAIILIGFLIVFMAVSAHLLGAIPKLGEWGPSVFLSSMIAGSVMILAGIYYVIKHAFEHD